MVAAREIRLLARRVETIVKLRRWTRFYASIPLGDLLDLRKVTLTASLRPYTMLTLAELSHLYDAASHLDRARIEGSFVECGVCNGGSAGAISAVAKDDPDRHVWLFDSWEGLPEPEADDVTYSGEMGKKGMALGSEEKVRELMFRKLKLSASRIHLVKGWFHETIPPCKKDIGKIALLHIDCDWYESVKFCLEELYDQVVEEGFIFLDDYPYWQGCRKAVDEFRSQRNIKAPCYKSSSTAVYFRKPGN